MKKKNRQEAISTFIGPETAIKGRVTFEGTIRVDGRLEGEIHSGQGVLIVGESARLEAQISVGTAVIRGQVTGTVQAGDKIEIYKPAKVVGDIKAPVVSIDSGVMFNGNCTMGAKTIAEGETKGDAVRIVPGNPPKKQVKTGAEKTFDNS